MHTWARDLRGTVRGLRRTPGFTITALATVSTAIAANIVIFSVINAVRRPEMPYRDPAGILSISEAYPPYGWTDVPTSLGTFADLRSGVSSLTDIAAYSQRRVSYADGEHAPARLQAAVVSANIWATLGVAPVLGRGFSEVDDQPGHTHPIIIGYRLWQGRYGLDPGVLQRWATIDGVRHAIVGVMPDGFRFPEAEDVWLPLGAILQNNPRAFDARDARAWRIAARLRTNATLTQASTELEALAARSAMSHPQSNRGWTLSAVPITQESFVATGAFFGALQAGALLLILVMCGNLGNLLLARGEQRRRELAIRGALGASRANLVGLLMAEAVLLTTAAAALALLVSAWAVHLVPLAISESIPFYIRFRIDTVVVAFTVVVALVTALAAGLGSALRVPKEAPPAATVIGTPSAGRLRSTFLFVQTAVAAALLASTFVVAAGLLRFHRMDLGFDPANTLVVEVPLPPGPRGTPDAATAFASRVLARLDGFPGVRAAGISSPVPLGVPPGDVPAIETATTREGSGPGEPPGNYVSVTPEFFLAAGMRIERGRGFTPDDVSGAEPIVVLNGEAARRLFGSTDPIGQRVRFGRDAASRRWRTIVGVVANTVVQPLDPEIDPRLYVPYDQDPGRLLTVTIRTAGDPELLARPVSAALNEIDPALAHETPVSAERQLSMALWPLRFFNGFAGGLAIFGVLVAAMGVYGLTRYLTLARSREIALRLALGAAPAAILRLVLRQSGLPVAAGIVTGLGASAAITNLLQHVLAGMAAFDPIALSAAAVSLGTAGGAALTLPAVRATRIDPAQALRHD